MKNILFIYAHLDDETILSYGTMLKLAENNKINILIICGQGRNVTVSANIEELQRRVAAFIENCKEFNYKLCLHKDITLTSSIVKQEISEYISSIAPDIVFSHIISDFHYEHRLVAEEVMLACRRLHNLTVKELYSTAAPSMMQAFGLKDTFKPNYFIDITKYAKLKQQALTQYSMELPADVNDIRSAESILASNRLYGRLMNVKYCEPYLQIFKLS